MEEELRKEIKQLKEKLKYIEKYMEDAGYIIADCGHIDGEDMCGYIQEHGAYCSNCYHDKLVRVQHNLD